VTDDGSSDGPSDAAVVEAAAEAAEGLVRSRYANSEIRELDVTVSFEDGRLDVDVYLDAPDDPAPVVVANDAVGAAESAVDALFEDG
jgi:predicted acyl esterase